VVRGAAKDNYTLSSIIQGIVQTGAFRRQGAVVKAPDERAAPTPTADAPEGTAKQRTISR
jgi:hypothetical protein